jgi:hypothetical protein
MGTALILSCSINISIRRFYGIFGDQIFIKIKILNHKTLFYELDMVTIHWVNIFQHFFLQ